MADDETLTDEELAGDDAPGAASSAVDTGNAAPVDGAEPAGIAQPAAGAPVLASLPEVPGALPGAARHTRTFSTPIISPEEAATAAQIPVNEAAGEAAIRAKGAVDVDRAQVLSDSAVAAEAESKRYAAEAAALAAKQREEEAKAVDAVKARQAEYDGTKFHDFYSTEGGGNRVLAAIASGIGAFAQGFGHLASNPAADIINAAIDRDFRLQKENIDKKYQAIGGARGDLGELRAQHMRELQGLAMRHAGALDSAASTKQSLLMKTGMPAAQSATEASVVELRQRSTKEQLAEQQSARRRVQDAYLVKGGKPGGGVGGAGTGDAISKLSAMAQQGATSAALTKEAYRLGLRDDAKHPTHVVDLVRKLQIDPEKQAALEVRDTQGNVIGTAGNSRAAQKAGEQISAAEAYKNSITALREHVARYGHILNLGGLVNADSDEAKVRKALLGDFLARGRKALELGVSQANIAIEHQIASGSGVGTERTPSLKVLDQLADEVDKIARTRINTTLRQGQPTTDERVPASTSPVARRSSSATPLTAKSAAILQTIIDKYPGSKAAADASKKLRASP